MEWRRATRFGVGIALFAPAASSAPPPSVRMVGEESGCPTSAQVATVLRRLLPRTKVIAENGHAGAEDAAIEDEGAEYRVRIAGQQRSFVDGARQCAERARHAAVFVALVLDPPSVPEPAEPPPAAPVPPPAPPPAERPVAPPPVPRAPLPLDLTLAPILLFAPGSADRQTSMAAGGMAWLRAKPGLHVAVGTGVLRGALRFDEVTADAWWIPIDVALGFSARADRWEGGAQIGPDATILSVRGRDLEGAASQLRLEWGGRAAGFARFWFDRTFALYLAAEALVRPSAYALIIEPQGQVGLTPVLWAGASAGITCKLE
jgi:hypothetical protein